MTKTGAVYEYFYDIMSPRCSPLIVEVRRPIRPLLFGHNFAFPNRLFRVSSPVDHGHPGEQHAGDQKHSQGPRMTNKISWCPLRLVDLPNCHSRNIGQRQNDAQRGCSPRIWRRIRTRPSQVIARDDITTSRDQISGEIMNASRDRRQQYDVAECSDWSEDDFEEVPFAITVGHDHDDCVSDGAPDLDGNCQILRLERAIT